MDIEPIEEKEKQEDPEDTRRKPWLQEQCEKTNGHFYAMRSRWGITWAECIHCGKRLKKAKKVKEDIKESEEVED